MTLVLTETDGQQHRPPMFRQAEGYSGPLFHHERDLPHPISTATHAWDQVEAALRRDVAAFEAAQALAAAEPSRNTEYDDLLVAHRELIYRVAEFTEAVADKVPPCFVPVGKKANVPASVREIRRHADQVCNKLKHNQNRLIPTMARTPFDVVLGYTVCEIHRGVTLQPSSTIHAERRAFSFACDIRQLLADVFIIGGKIGRLIESRGDIRDTQCTPTPSSRFALFRAIQTLPTVIFPFERSAHMPLWQIDGSTLTIKRIGGQLRYPLGTVTMATMFRGDGVIRSFAVP